MLAKETKKVFEYKKQKPKNFFFVSTSEQPIRDINCRPLWKMIRSINHKDLNFEFHLLLSDVLWDKKLKGMLGCSNFFTSLKVQFEYI